MKRQFGIFGLAMALMVGGAMPALAQSVTDGSGRSDAAQAAVKAVAGHFRAPQDVRFRKIHTGNKGAVCGEVTGDGATVFSTFGVVSGEEPVMFENQKIPAALDFKEVNTWLNRNVALEDLEEMGCVPKGTYMRYRDRLNKVMETRKENTSTR
ncbi:hypothetical protein [Acetobacter fallax]|uniref:Lipoprotein n=1 Tax=Acetobacter fallax TaxID=1737473 RepID=A0ABX0KD91_9PROT|nr:hypothetical protein [Acetobacter fallax]NHO33773.1 hypothetical protein [Acetobacter fallax]NHO37334.1 hypothetical protein [Acetobacter fallax]